MIDFDDHPFRILVIRDFGSGKTNSLFNLISQRPDNCKTFLCQRSI